jgi:TetR/AcrR family transcriptional regulator
MLHSLLLTDCQLRTRIAPKNASKEHAMPRDNDRRDAIPPRRRTRDAERTRAAILRAARDVFILGDYNQASLSDIARRAGVTQSLIHHHYGSKKGLYISALHAYLAELNEDLRNIMRPSLAASEGAPAFIASAIRGYFRFLSENKQCVRLYRILDLSLSSDPDLVAGLGELDEQGREMSSLHLMRAALEQLTIMKRAGQLREGVEPLALLTSLLCTVEHWFTSSRRLSHRMDQTARANGMPGGLSGEEFVETAIAIYVNGALAPGQGGA